MGVIHRVRSADGAELALEQIGARGPNVLMVPGSGQGRHAWLKVAELLCKDYTCWLLDRRGRGDSGDAEPYTLRREYEDVALIVRSMDTPVVLAGHSSGATCILGAVGEIGASPSALALYEPAWPIGGPLPGVDRADDLELLVNSGDSTAALSFALEMIIGMPVNAVQRMKSRPEWDLWAALIRTWPRELRELNLLPRDVRHLAQIPVPSLVLVGQSTSGYLAAAARAVAAALPNSRLAELENQRHSALDSAPDLVVQAITQWTRALGIH